MENKALETATLAAGCFWCVEPIFDALIGVEDLVVVDTPDALLVVPRARAQEVKGIVDRLADLGREHLR